MEDVRAALAALPENQRRALVLREWHGASSDEIATELQLSEPATHALLFRARKSFATAMSASRSAATGLNVVALLELVRTYVKPFLGGAAAKAAVATTAAGVVVGGVVLEVRVDPETPSPSATPDATIAMTPRAAFVPLEHAPVPVRGVNPRVGTPRPQFAAEVRAARDSASTAPVSVPDGDGPVPGVAPKPPTAASSAEVPAVPALPSPVIPDPPVPAAPTDLLPTLGDDPPVPLPPPLDELLPPDELPPLDPPPLPSPQVPSLPLP